MRWSVAPYVKLFAALVVLGVLGLVATPARAQIPGDANGDGTVDAADLAGLAACMGGPGSEATPACLNIFTIGQSQGHDGWVGLFGPLSQQVAASRKNACTFWNSPSGIRRFPNLPYPTRGYVFVREYYPTATVYGAQATIDTSHRPRLCGQPTSAATAFSLRWVSIVGPAPNQNGQWWVQSGVATRRRWNNPVPPPTTTITTDAYTEIQGQQSSSYRLRFFAVPAAPTLFTSEWYPTGFSPQRTALFRQEGIEIDHLSNADLPSSSGGTNASWTGETLNLGDYMAGSLSSPCRFRDCKWEVGAQNNFLSIEFFDGDLVVNPSAYFSGYFVGADGFDMFDWW